jgi:hypothetical protein
MDDGNEVRRWHFWGCWQSALRKLEARLAIRKLRKLGFKAKVWTPRSEHKHSGHIHVSMLATWNEILKLSGLNRNKTFNYRRATPRSEIR